MSSVVSWCATSIQYSMLGQFRPIFMVPAHKAWSQSQVRSVRSSQLVYLGPKVLIQALKTVSVQWTFRHPQNILSLVTAMVWHFPWENVNRSFVVAPTPRASVHNWDSTWRTIRAWIWRHNIVEKRKCSNGKKVHCLKCKSSPLEHTQICSQ